MPTTTYSGGYLPGVPTRNSFLGKTKIDLPRNEPLLFIPVDVEDLPDYKNNTYTMRLTGFTEEGYKLCLIVENIDVFFDIRKPDDESDSDFTDKIETILERNEIEYKSMKDLMAYPLFNFHESPVPYRRMFMETLSARRQAIEVIRQKGYETANDDKSCYYRKVARDYQLPLSDWLVIKKHKLMVNERFATSYVDIRDIAPYTGELRDSLKREKCLVMTWDIETYSRANTGEVPKPHKQDTDLIFMICCSFHWAMDTYETEPLYKVCLTDKRIRDDPNVHTIVCENERNILRAFGQLVYTTGPDIIIGFNDHDYDWDWVIERANQYELLKTLYNKLSIIPNLRASDDYIYNRMVMKREMKISPEEKMFCKFIKPVGIIPIDIRVCLKKLYKKEEITKGSSLNFYLRISKLDQKVDLPHTEMFKIYEEGDPEKLALVRHYCVVDAVSCFKLFSKQLIMSTLRENATLSYISIFDENFYAVSMKIANKIIAEAKKHNILCSNIIKEKTLTEKFSGAHVFDPEKGLEDRRPIIPEDFKSLYPSIIMAYNLSPETFVPTEEYAKELEAKGRNTYYLEFEYAGQLRQAWFVRHDSNDAQWGLVPKILKGLFSSRVAIQKAQKTIDRKLPEGDFEYNRLEIKQKAIKVFMNSIYGVSGMDINPLFLLEQAVAITSTGRKLINKVAEFVRGKGYFVKYGDSVASYTDIVYRFQNRVTSCAIKDLTFGLHWQSFTQPGHEDKEFCDLTLLHVEVWSDDGWTKLQRVIRHKLGPVKRMYRVTTVISSVDVTEDHSLLDHTKTPISPKDLLNNFQDYRLLHHPLPYFKQQNYLLDVENPEQQFIQQLYPIDYSPDDYVYDLTTENHHFAVGRHGLIVHNTDSVYLRPPNHYFQELDQDFQNNKISKLEYWTKMVQMSSQLSEDIRDEINAYLADLVGNTYIKMENEEVKFPVIFTGKKKYAGIAHYHDKRGDLVVDFYPEKLFIKGIDIIKEGQPMLAITIGNRILRRILDVNKPEEKEVLNIVEEVFNDAIENPNQWTMDDFVQSDAYRPLKDNKTVQRFVARMREKHQVEVDKNKRLIASGNEPEEVLFEPPSPGERFKYIVVKQKEFFDLKGKTISLKKGDLMEYVHVVKKLGLEIDIGEYLKSKIAGICARFINYHQKFQPESSSAMTMKEIDEYCQKKAKKFLEEIVDRYSQPLINHHQCKRVYKAVQKKAKQQLGNTFDFLQDLESIKDAATVEAVKPLLVNLASKAAEEKTEVIKRRNKQMLSFLNIDKDGSDISEVSAGSGKKTSKILFAYYRIFPKIIRDTERDIDHLLSTMDLESISELVKKYNTTFENLVLRSRDALTAGGQEEVADTDLPMLDTDELSAIDKFRSQYQLLISEVTRLKANNDLFKALTSLRSRRVG
jgi:DNA polymerase elongation subunit (family B)